MSDVLGVLGQASATAVGTTTAYTCPANFGAKVRIMHHEQGGNGSTLQIFVNGMLVASPAAFTTNYFAWSARGGGVSTAPAAADATGLATATTPAPADPIYYLSPGDTIQYIVGVQALVSMNFQVVGIAVDLTEGS